MTKLIKILTYQCTELEIHEFARFSHSGIVYCDGARKEWRCRADFAVLPAEAVKEIKTRIEDAIILEDYTLHDADFQWEQTPIRRQD